MNELLKRCQAEEDIAHIHGWDFSHIEGRYEEKGALPWDYKAEVLKRLRRDMRLLDLDTGGGEMLLSLGHPFKNTAATENYPPNVRLCEETLIPLGIDFKKADVKKALPFEDESFDMVTDRHGDLNPKEIRRVLKKGGVFVTQQVGADNDRELVRLLMGKDCPSVPFPEQYLSTQKAAFEAAGFEIEAADECFRPIRFFDVGALTWFARIIEWEFIGFSVNTHKEGLIASQRVLDEKGFIEGKTHRFFMACRKL